MKKRLLTFILVIIAAAAVCGYAGGQTLTTDSVVTEAKIPEAFREQSFPVIRGGGMPEGTVILRFYNSMPHVAYISAADYLKLWIPEAEMRVEQTAPGVYKLTSPTGTALVDTGKDTFFSEDFAAFTNLMGLVQEGMDNTLYDGMPYLKFIKLETEPASAPTSFDFSKYNIDLFGEEDAVYFPFALISDLYSDLFIHHSGFNGEKVVMNFINNDSLLSVVDPDYPQGLVSPEHPLERQPDLADFTYNELCFVMDHFYGRPGHEKLYGREDFHAAFAEKGLDKALDEYGDTGKLMKTYLKSENTAEYYVGMDGLFFLFYDGGHTTFNQLEMNGVIDLEEAGELADKYFELIDSTSLFDPLAETEESYVNDTLQNRGLAQQRDKIYGIETDYSLYSSETYYSLYSSETYLKQGDTAVCILNGFWCDDIDSWRDYYAGEGPEPWIEKAPGGNMSEFLDALYRAEADPEVRNLVIDASVNNGGSSDIVMAIVSLITGRNEFSYENVLTGQRSTVTYAVDRNFDRVFDEKDDNVHFDLNFAVLTSPYAFSGGNLFPSIMHDMGYLLLGERSGGGACAITVMNTADGFDYFISSFRVRLINDAGENIDSGIPVDVDLVNRQKILDLEIVIPGYEDRPFDIQMPDYSAFYDIENLSRLIKEAYTVPEEITNRIDFFRINDFPMPDNKELPRTGFSSQQPSRLRDKPLNIAYKPTSLTLQLPTLSVESEILIVPEADGDYPVEWLGSAAGLLEGFAMPGEGYSLITGHNHLNTTEAGPFALLSSLEEGDRIFVSDDDGGLEIFKVYASEKIGAADSAALARIAQSREGSLTLLTCEDESPEGGYISRRVVAAQPVDKNITDAE